MVWIRKALTQDLTNLSHHCHDHDSNSPSYSSSPKPEVGSPVLQQNKKMLRGSLCTEQDIQSPHCYDSFAPTTPSGLYLADRRALEDVWHGTLAVQGRRCVGWHSRDGCEHIPVGHCRHPLLSWAHSQASPGFHHSLDHLLPGPSISGQDVLLFS